MLMVLAASFDIHIIATHLPGICSSAADMLSQNQRAEFLTAYAQFLCHHLLYVIYPLKCSAGHPAFLQHFMDMLT